MKRSYMKPMSRKMRVQIQEEKSVRAAFRSAHPWCMLQEAGYDHDCYGPWSCHEPWTRARGGPTNDPRNMVVCCSEGNRLVSQDPDAMKWAKANGWLVSAWEGAAWLEKQRHICKNGARCPFYDH